MKAKRIMALLLAAVMTITPAIPAAAAETDGLQNPVLKLEFENNLNDDSGKGNNGTLSAGDPEYVEGVKGQALKLNGSSYVNLGTSTDLQPENLTLSFWMKPNADMGNAEQVITWSKTTYNSDGWYLSSEGSNVPLAISIGPSSGQPYKVSVSGMTRAEFFKTDEWTHVVVTYDKATKEVKFYRNGTQCETTVNYAVDANRTGVLGSDASMEKSIGYNGPSYKGSYLNAMLDSYQLYNDVATQDEVTELYKEGEKTAETEKIQNSVLKLEFDSNLNDDSGKGNNGTLSAGDPEYVEGVKGQALKLNGSSYVNLGTSTDLQPENLTLSFWMKPNADMGNAEQVITWSKTTYNSDGWYLSAENGNVPLAISIGPSSGQPYKVSVSGMTRAEFFKTDEWTHVVVTYDKATKEVKFYRNGTQCETTVNYAVDANRTGVLGSDASMEKSIGYNGPNYKGSYLNASLDSYQLYNDVATQEQVIALYEESGKTIDKKAVAQADLDALSIPTETKGSVALLSKGASGSDITWTSSNESVIAKDGTVVRPALGAENVIVTLTAAAVYAGGEKVTKTFEVTVLAQAETSLAPSSIMGDVTLQDAYLVNASQKEVDYLLSMSSKKFLYEFYRVAGLTPPTNKNANFDTKLAFLSFARKALFYGLFQTFYIL